MCPARLLTSMLLAAVSPLTEDERVRLATAYDGRDHQEEAFVALLDNVRRWTPGVGDVAVRIEPDLEAMLERPQDHRGELCRIAGRLEQQTRLERPYEGVLEWFVRDESDRPVLLYAVDADATRPFREGERVMLMARFYKSVEAVARDGERHRYPAFVGAFPTAVGGGEAWVSLWVVSVPVVVMFVVFLVLLVYARRGQGRGRSRWSGLGRAVADEKVDGPLPADPAEALLELRRRAEAD